MSSLTLEQKQRAMRMQVLTKIRSSLELWCINRMVYGDNLLDLSSLLNELLDNKSGTKKMFRILLFSKSIILTNILECLNLLQALQFM